jgi:hypothetical protein
MFYYFSLIGNTLRAVERSESVQIGSEMAEKISLPSEVIWVVRE